MFIGGALIAASLGAFVFLRSRDGLRIAAAVVGAVGLATVIIAYVRLNGVYGRQQELVRERCHSYAVMLRGQLESNRDLNTSPQDPRALDEWHDAHAAARALWTLCVPENCEWPYSYTAKPEVMQNTADMLDSGECLK